MDTKGRDIIDVYEQIDTCIPMNYNDLKNELFEYILTLAFKAPEVRKSADTYILFARILYKYTKDLNEDWVQIVKDIFSDKNL